MWLDSRTMKIKSVMAGEYTEFARDASSSHGLCATLETYVYSSDAGENEVQDEPMGEQPALKRCTACKTHKPLAEFCKDSSRRDGKHTNCKVSRYNRRKERKEMEDDAEGGENAAPGTEEEPPRKRSKGDDLYVFKNSRLPEYKIGRSSDIAARCQALQRSQNFYTQRVATFEGKGHLEDTVREMLAYCLLPREVAAGTEWHTCSLQTEIGRAHV